MSNFEEGSYADTITHIVTSREYADFYLRIDRFGFAIGLCILLVCSDGLLKYLIEYGME